MIELANLNKYQFPSPGGIPFPPRGGKRECERVGCSQGVKGARRAFCSAKWPEATLAHPPTAKCFWLLPSDPQVGREMPAGEAFSPQPGVNRTKILVQGRQWRFGWIARPCNGRGRSPARIFPSTLGKRGKSETRSGFTDQIVKQLPFPRPRIMRSASCARSHFVRVYVTRPAHTHTHNTRGQIKTRSTARMALFRVRRG